MSHGPTKGPNGADSLDAIRAAAIAKAGSSPLVFQPDTGATLFTAQRSKFPYLEAFAARGKLAPDGKSMESYELSLGIRIGLATGRNMTLTMPQRMSARALAALLRQTADSLDRWAVECEDAGTDPRDQQPPATPAALTDSSAPKGDGPLPAAPAVDIAVAVPCPGASWYAGEAGNGHRSIVARCTACGRQASEHHTQVTQVIHKQSDPAS